MAEQNIHFEKTGDEVANLVRNSSLEYAYVVNPGTGNPFPGKKVIGRFSDDNEQSYVGRGASGADEWWAANAGRVAEAAPYLWAIAVCNEPTAPSTESAAYQARWIDSCRVRWPKLLIGALDFSTGCPEPDTASAWTLVAAKADLYFFHEYFLPYHWEHEDAWLGWLVGRYQKFVANLPALYRNRPVFITEAGCDGLLTSTFTYNGSDNKEEGWTIRCPNEDTYLSYIARAKAVYDKDARVKAVFEYGGDPWPRWMSYRITLSLANKMLALNATTSAPSTTEPVTIAPSSSLETRVTALESALAKLQSALSDHTGSEGTVRAFGYDIVYRK